MLRALSSAVSGMETQMSYMDVVANNIANVNTTAYKSVQARFADMLYQNLQNGEGGTTNAGDINPLQIGLGVTLAATDNDMQEGALQQTGNPLDLAIQGDGMFALKDSSGTLYYTRDGAFSIDSSNDLVNTATGMQVQDASGAKITIDPTKYSSIAVGADGTIVGTNVDGSGTTKLQQIGMSTFPNMAGLTRDGNNLWSASAASGTVAKVDTTQPGAPQISSGVLEGSNTNLATEMSNMVQSERAFQANSKVITTADTMLQSLVTMTQ